MIHVGSVRNALWKALKMRMWNFAIDQVAFFNSDRWPDPASHRDTAEVLSDWFGIGLIPPPPVYDVPLRPLGKAKPRRRSPVARSLRETLSDMFPEAATQSYDSMTSEEAWPWRPTDLTEELNARRRMRQRRHKSKRSTTPRTRRHRRHQLQERSVLHSLLEEGYRRERVMIREGVNYADRVTDYFETALGPRPTEEASGKKTHTKRYHHTQYPMRHGHYLEWDPKGLVLGPLIDPVAANRYWARSRIAEDLQNASVHQVVYDTNDGEHLWGVYKVACGTVEVSLKDQTKDLPKLVDPAPLLAKEMAAWDDELDWQAQKRAGLVKRRRRTRSAPSVAAFARFHRTGLRPELDVEDSRRLLIQPPSPPLDPSYVHHVSTAQTAKFQSGATFVGVWEQTSTPPSSMLDSLSCQAESLPANEPSEHSMDSFCSIH
ncbi:MAG: uncharacterized protein KVP18_002924 [Porospora cf. gigantea A]|uniref:uncharacterized protein n=1 Tax=Porospora cf. gigantea A TaxID=2853593 RepID=UPI00355A1987|nr:MAG: hypothetical protein KVP18_002924 [Porospora cf. gigantea A]